MDTGYDIGADEVPVGPTPTPTTLPTGTPIITPTATETVTPVGTNTYARLHSINRTRWAKYSYTGVWRTS